MSEIKNMSSTIDMISLITCNIFYFKLTLVAEVGAAETGICDMISQCSSSWRTYIQRPLVAQVIQAC